MGKSHNDNLLEFFATSQAKPWGRLLAVHTQATVLEPIVNKDIPEKIIEVISEPDWQTESSAYWSSRNSSDTRFYLFKLWELWKSIRTNGVKSPVHLHIRDGHLTAHPSNNKKEVLYEFFPDADITVFFHDYDLIRELYPTQWTEWYKDLPYEEIQTAYEYMDYYDSSLKDSNIELEFGWDYCSNILADKHTWSKLTPKKWDWRHVGDHTGDPRWENALFLTVTDRYHRVKMKSDDVQMKDVIQVKPGRAKFCGKWYDIDE